MGLWQWSTFWAAFGSIATALGAGAVGFLVYQLRFDAWLKAQEVFTGKDFVRARTTIFSSFDNPRQPWPIVGSEDAKEVCRKMDEMAHLLPFVGRKKWFLTWGNPMAKAWLLLEPTVNEQRDATHQEDKWYAFEKLGVEAVSDSPKLVEFRDSVLRKSNR